MSSRSIVMLHRVGIEKNHIAYQHAQVIPEIFKIHIYYSSILIWYTKNNIESIIQSYIS